MNCETCTYASECPSADTYPESAECVAAEVIDINEHRRTEAFQTKSVEGKLFDAIDDTLSFLCWWIIGGGVVLVAWNLLRGWLVGCVNP